MSLHGLQHLFLAARFGRIGSVVVAGATMLTIATTASAFVPISDLLNSGVASAMVGGIVALATVLITQRATKQVQNKQIEIQDRAADAANATAVAQQLAAFTAAAVRWQAIADGAETEREKATIERDALKEQVGSIQASMILLRTKIGDLQGDLEDEKDYCEKRLNEARDFYEVQIKALRDHLLQAGIQVPDPPEFPMTTLASVVTTTTISSQVQPSIPAPAAQPRPTTLNSTDSALDPDLDFGI